MNKDSFDIKADYKDQKSVNLIAKGKTTIAWKFLIKVNSVWWFLEHLNRFMKPTFLQAIVRIIKVPSLKFRPQSKWDLAVFEIVYHTTNPSKQYEKGYSAASINDINQNDKSCNMLQKLWAVTPFKIIFGKQKINSSWTELTPCLISLNKAKNISFWFQKKNWR